MDAKGQVRMQVAPLTIPFRAALVCASLCVLAPGGMITSAFAQQTQTATTTRPQQSGPQKSGPQKPGQQQQQPAGQQQAAPQRIFGPQPAGTNNKAILGPQTPSPAPPAVPKAPFTLSPEERQRLDQILAYWELTSGKVKTFDCRFKRWEYRDVFSQRPDHLWAISEGIIRYAAPDKGELKTVKRQQYGIAENSPAGTAPDLNEVPANEHWICDGASVFRLDSKAQRLEEVKLPAEMRGQQIADGPLPFMFGAEKEKLLRRYWIREVRPPQDRQDEYWLEVWPKFADDAANFQRVTIILDKEMFLPVGMNVYLAEHQEFDPALQQGNIARDAYQFFDRSNNALRHKTQQFFGSFIAPDLPRGWTHEVLGEEAPAGTAGTAEAPAAPAAARTSRRPQP